MRPESDVQPALRHGADRPRRRRVCTIRFSRTRRARSMPMASSSATASADALVRVAQQAMRLYHNPAAWRKLIRNGMTADHSWRASAREYGKVYRRARAAERPEAPRRGRCSDERVNSDHGFRKRADLQRRQLRRGRAQGRPRRCSWISGRNGAARAARWSPRSMPSPPTIRARSPSGKLNVDDNPSITMRYMVRGIPTVMLFKGGQIVDQAVGLVGQGRAEADARPPHLIGRLPFDTGCACMSSLA